MGPTGFIASPLTETSILSAFEGNCTLFCLVDIRKRSCVTTCVFWLDTPLVYVSSRAVFTCSCCRTLHPASRQADNVQTELEGSGRPANHNTDHSPTSHSHGKVELPPAVCTARKQATPRHPPLRSNDKQRASPCRDQLIAMWLFRYVSYSKYLPWPCYWYRSFGLMGT